MITEQQVKQLSKKFQISDSVVVREFVQLLFLKELYEQNFSKNIFFKGGTAIRLIWGGHRFSEDLDFTVNMPEEEFEEKILSFFQYLENIYTFKIKERKSIVGYTYLLTAEVPFLKSKVYIKLDFSTREQVLEPKQSILKTEYPVIFQSFVNTLSIDEIFAEKIRAVMTRVKHRDLYDLWILLELGAKFNDDLVTKKLRYYDIKKIDSNILEERIKLFSKKNFVKDLAPFVPRKERENLASFFDYILKYLDNSFKNISS
ncbi:MAG: nucleotidyl transferase AbiEii/AbiGii toxin family protein [Candidatus Dojkabacteria bacterium]|jgi:predicted nucleotidyltransferase component of viral defense system